MGTKEKCLECEGTGIQVIEYDKGKRDKEECCISMTEEIDCEICNGDGYIILVNDRDEYDEFSLE